MLMHSNDLWHTAAERFRAAERMFGGAMDAFDSCKDLPEDVCSAIKLNRLAMEELSAAINMFVFLSELKDRD